jgi:lysophospholipase L1-like esterase
MLTRTSLLTLALLVVAGCGATANPHPKDIDAYVALGDSYTALSGIGPYTDKACSRTATNYPNLVAKDLDIAAFTDVSCGGATSAELTQTQVLLNNAGTRAPQLDALSKKTKLVTIGIGLNDYQLSYYLLYVCIPVNGITQPACGPTLRQPESALAAKVKNMAGLVKGNLKDIRHAAPNARVVLVGYPRVLPDDRACPTALPLPDAAATLLRKALKLVDEQLARTAKKEQVDYVDMYVASKGHELCSTEPWVAGQTTVPGKALAFHPYQAYHRAVADKILALLQD